MNQISTATTKLTEPYSRLARKFTSPGAIWPRPNPARIASATQTER